MKNILADSRQRKKWIVFVIITIICLAVLYVFLDKAFIQPAIRDKNRSQFQSSYEEELLPILEANSLELISIEYTELIPDYDLDYWEIDRINEYEVKVYVSGSVGSYDELYDLIIDIRCANNYLLSNTYEKMSNGAYVDDECKETGFHEVHTTLIFEDDTSYKIDYISLLKNNEVVWKQDRKPVTEESMVNQADAAGWDCMYEDCDSKRAEGRLYCHIHKCNEPGCMHETSPLQSYCEQHRKKN